MANDKFRAIPQIVGNVTVPNDEPTERIASSDFLPGYLQTAKNKKFLNVTLDPLIEKGTAEDINAYVGRKSGTVYRPATDPYVAEPRQGRENYQFDVGVVSKDPDGNIVNHLAYADILSQYTKQYSGFVPTDLDATFYSWAPPIDVDKFVNFTNYYWFPLGLPFIEISGDIDIENDIIDQASYTYINEAGKKINISNGMRIYFTENTIVDSSYVTNTVSDTLTNITSPVVYFTVTGVGKSIKLLDATYSDPSVTYVNKLQEPWDSNGWDTTGWDTTQLGNPEPEYILMARGATNKNVWSRINQWQHQDCVRAIATYLDKDPAQYLMPYARARRSIIEFNENLELYNHGRKSKLAVDIVASNITSASIIGNVSSIVDSVYLKAGDRILFINNSTDTAYNKIFKVVVTGGTIQLVPEIDATPILNETVLVKGGEKFKFTELYYDGTSWVKAQQKKSRNQFPLFTLYDNLGKSLSDTTSYKNNNFIGNTLFQYKSGSFIDAVLGFGIEYEDTNYDILNNASPYAKNFTNVKFTWTQNTTDLYYETSTGRSIIPGYYYFKLFDGAANYSLSNGWVHNSNEALTMQRISHTATSTKPEENIIEVPSDYLPSYDYEAFLDEGQLLFNLISKSGASFLWDPSERHLVWPIGTTKVIKNKSGLNLTIKDSKGVVILPPVVTNNNSAANLSLNVVALSTTISDNILYLECSAGRLPIYLVDPAEDNRSLTIRVNGKVRTDYIKKLMSTGNYTIQLDSVATNDYIEAIFSSNTQAGVYSTHATLEANADNADIYDTSYSKLFEHFVSAISSQPQITGRPYGTNSYFNSAKNMAAGYVIQQQNASSLLPGILSAAKLDTAIILKKTGELYASFRYKFINKLIQLGEQEENTTLPSWQLVNLALSQINVGKNSSFPFAFSNTIQWNDNFTTKTYPASGTSKTFPHYTDYTAGNIFNNHIYAYVDGVFATATYTNDSVILDVIPAPNAIVTLHIYSKEQLSIVPPSLAKLGITTPYKPEIVFDGGKSYIKCHDGTEISVFEPAQAFVNNAIMEFENRVFSAITVAPITLQTQGLNEPGLYRHSAKTISDKNKFLEQYYRKWAAMVGIVDSNNLVYSSVEPFTWKYKTLKASIFTELINPDTLTQAGSWRAIYTNLFDTDRPHLAPWEMLGFTIKPAWWDTHYSWVDTAKRAALESALHIGQVSQPGTSVTIKTQYARPGAVFPVSTAGKLLDPVTANIATNANKDDKSPWVFGEYGEQETIWRKSAHYQWAEAIWKFVSAPNKFVSQNFDPYDLVPVASKYLVKNNVTKPEPVNYIANTVSKTTGKRIRASELVLHRENNAQCSGLNQLFAEYIVSQNKNLTTDYYQPINYGSVQMIHKIGGFADKRTLAYKADTLKVSVGSNFIPEENFTLELYTGAPYETAFYSGVKVTWTGDGYEVMGYDTTKNYFEIYTPRLAGRTKAISYNNISIIDIIDYSEDTTRVHYGTVFATKQEVYNLFTGLNKVMIEQGFVFDQYDQDQQGIIDFKMSGKQFMFWAESNWAPGNYIALSPMSEQVKFTHEYGWVSDYESIADYDPIVDLRFAKITTANLDFDRTQEGELIIGTTTADQGIFGLAINLSEIEHTAVFDNLTTFGDTVYNPVYRLKQYRLKYAGQRTKDWNGTPRSPGFLLNGDKIIGNFNRTIGDIADRYYSVEGSTQNSRFMSTARHSVGVEKGGVLSEIIGNENTQFEFQRAALRQKGTPAAYNKLLRSSAVEVTSNDILLADEEWMFKISDFGNVDSIRAWEFKLRHEDFKESKQLIRFSPSYYFNKVTGAKTKVVDAETDRIIDLPFDDTRWLYKPVVYEKNNTAFSFEMRKHRIGATEINYSSDGPTAGYAFVDQADLTAETIDDIANLYSSLTEMSSYRYKIWVSDYSSKVDDLNAARCINQHVPLGWNMLVQQNTGLKVKVIYLLDSELPTQPAAVEFTTAHYLTPGTIIVINDAEYLSGVHVVKSVVDTTTITIDAIATSEIITGSAMQFMPTRFADTTQLDSVANFGTGTNYTVGLGKYNWQDGDTIYVDDIAGSYEIYTVSVTVSGSALVKNRIEAYAEQDKTNTDSIKSVVLYDKKNNRTLITLDLYDPVKGHIPSSAEKDIDIRGSYDPAIYSFTTDDEVTINTNCPWGAKQEGTVWWDLSTSKFINYEQGSLEYRHNNWGRLFPGASIDVYQWISSTVDPVAYNKASSTGTPINDIMVVGQARMASVNSSDVYSYSTEETVNRDGTVMVTYYFWVKNLDTVSLARPDKKLTVTAIAKIIEDPDSMDISWAAPIAENAMIVSNVVPYLNNHTTSLQIQIAESEEHNLGMKPEVHTQWMLLRENDSVNRIPVWFHNKLRDSLAGFDKNSQVVTYTNYEPTFLYSINSVFSIKEIDTDIETFYLVTRQFTDADLTKELPESPVRAESNTNVKPVYKLYDYELLPKDNVTLPKIKLNNSMNVPFSLLNEFDKYGNRVRPTQQTWIKDRDMARRTFIASVNKLLATMDLFENIPKWDRHLKTIKSGKLEYDITKFYDVIDYISATFDNLQPIVATYKLETDVPTSAESLAELDGKYIAVSNENIYAVYLVSKTDRSLIFRKNATIQFNEDLFNNIKQQYAWDSAPWTFNDWDSDPGIEFSEIVTAFREDIFVNKYAINYNKLFFDMVRYIFSENDTVDWIAKSSYLYIDNLNVDSLVEKPYFVEDSVQQYIDYINEVKPYRTKVRQVIDTRSVVDATESAVNDIKYMESEFWLADVSDTTVSSMLEIEVTTNYLNEEYKFNVVIDNTGTKYNAIINGVSKPIIIAETANQPYSNNLMFNSLGKTLCESDNPGALQIKGISS